MIGWGAVRTLARHEWRVRWRTVLVLGLAGALFAGTTLAITTVLWRTTTVYDRLVARTALDDVRVSISTATPEFADRAAAVRLQQRASAALQGNSAVTGHEQLAVFIGRLAGPGVVYTSLYAPTDRLGPTADPVLVQGHAPRPDDGSGIEQVMVEEGRAAAAHLRVGQRLRLQLLTPVQYTKFSTGIGEPAGARVVLEVVGIFRFPRPRFGFDSLVTSTTFAASHRADSIGAIELLSTRGHVGPGRGPGSINAIADEYGARLQVLGTGQQGAISVDEPRRTPDPAIGPTRAVLRSGLVALAAVVAVAGFILVSQLAGRWAERGRNGQEIENALGLRTIERVLGRLLAAAPALVLIAVGAVTGALLGGIPQPLGSLKQYEPTSGWLPRLDITIGGAVATVLIVLLVLVTTTLRAGRPRRLPAGRRGRWWQQLPLGRMPVLAVSLSSGRGGPSTSVPARSMVAGLAAMLAALVVVGETQAQLSPLRDHPARWGWTADFGVADDTPALDAQLLADRRVRDLEQLSTAPVTVQLGNGAELHANAYGRLTLRGDLPWTVGAGRLPKVDDEVALGPRLARDLNVAVGDNVSFTSQDQLLSMKVVGIALVSDNADGGVGRSALFTAGGLRLAAGTTGFSTLLIRAVDAGAERALHDQLARHYELTEPDPPASIGAIDDLGTPTRVLLLILLLAAALLIGQNTRLLLRRRGTQLAIVDAMGLSRREVIGAAAASVLWTSLVAAAIGLPLGWALSRIVLVRVGPRLGLILHSPGVLAAVVVGAAVLVVTAIVALGATAVALGRRRPMTATLDS